ncbi:hypothetical protein K1719_000770 [Acacia pycnantha]|nr:hypothetical protein K1719_000770 [Acacia pycnantha]
MGPYKPKKTRYNSLGPPKQLSFNVSGDIIGKKVHVRGKIDVDTRNPNACSPDLRVSHVDWLPRRPFLWLRIRESDTFFFLNSNLLPLCSWIDSYFWIHDSPEFRWLLTLLALKFTGLVDV